MDTNDTPTSTEYRVLLDGYSGPLDLLLYLVKRHEIDLNDIPIAKLTDQYLAHLELLKAIDFDNVAEFLVMASTLLEIKSAMLAAQVAAETGEELPEDDEDPTAQIDPRHELVQQLLEYKRYKDAAIALSEKHEDWRQRFTARPAKAGADASEQPPELDLEDLDVLDLCEAFTRIMASIGSASNQHEVTRDDTPIGLHAEDIVDRLQREGDMPLQQMFEGRSRKSEMIGLFLATLELVRNRRVRAYQDDPGSEIMLALRSEEEIAAELEAEQEAAQTDPQERWKNPQTGEIEYAWASEADRLRAERRAKLRQTYAKKKAAEESDDEDEVDEEPAEDEFDETDDEPTG
mgnify:CR=1 FL=1